MLSEVKKLLMRRPKLLRSENLWPDAQGDLAYINSFVIDRALTDISSSWLEIVREYSDERSYLSLSLVTRPDDDGPIVQIEFGVQDSSSRHATGGLVGRWAIDRQAIEGLENILLDGVSCDVSPFVARLMGFLLLPLTLSDTVEQNLD